MLRIGLPCIANTIGIGLRQSTLVRGSRVVSSTEKVANFANLEALTTHSSAISPQFRASVSRRTFSTCIQPSVPKEDFFNRVKEIRALTAVFKDKPQLSVISGPVDSGKTALLLHVLKRLEEDEDFPILHINLRERSFSTVNGFRRSLEKEMQSWVGGFVKRAGRMKVDATISGVNIRATLKEKDENQNDIEALETLFKSISDHLPPYDWWAGKRYPILFIDEANALNKLLDDEAGHEALLKFFEWFVLNTKELRRFHVVLASSDSFFHLWVSKFIGSSRFKSYIIGNLSKQEAEQFWTKRVITRTDRLGNLAAPSFEDAFEACGGNIHYLESYFSQYLLLNGILHPYQFHLVRNERAKYLHAIHNKSKKWSKEHFYSLCEKFVSSKNGYLIYDEICNELGDEIVDEFINDNLIHLRPTDEFAYDLVDAPKDRAVVTPETQAGLIAMKQLLELSKQ